LDGSAVPRRSPQRFFGFAALWLKLRDRSRTRCGWRVHRALSDEIIERYEARDCHRAPEPALVSIKFGIDAEMRSLESIADPLSSGR
jgi:hypothetical protein